MSIRKIRAGRVPSITAAQYIGEKGTIFWNESTGAFRLSDGHTLGGISIGIVTNSVITENVLPDVDNVFGVGDPTHRWNHLHIGDGGIYFDGNQTSNAQTLPYLPGAITTDLVPLPTNNSLHLGSATHRWGDVYIGRASLHLLDDTLGTDVALTVDNGTLYLNGAANLAIGNLIIQDTTLKTINPATNINIGDPADTGLTTIGRQTVITTPNLGTFTSALLINGATTLPVDPSPLTFNGTMIHTVAQAGQSSRIVQDAFGTGTYPIYVGRAARGTIASPTASSTGDILLRLSGNGYGSDGFGSGGTARIDFTAVEPYTNVAKGSRIDFWTTPAGTTSITNNASVTSDGFKGNGYTFTADDTRQTTAGIPLTQKKIANAPYVATLDSTGKLDPTQIPDALTGAIVFKGTWNATTNTPTLSNTLPAGLDTGWEYIVDVPGTRDIGDGSKSFLAGDFVIFDGTHWKQVPSGNAFVSLTSGGHITVNQTTGAMTLGSDATPTSTVSTIVSRDSSGNFAANVITASLSGNVTGNVTGNVSGNAGTVTNGVYTTGTYANPSWITSLDYSKLSGSVPTAYTSVYIGTTSVAFNRASGALSLAGVSIDGNAGTVTNGVYTNGSYSDPSWLTLSKSKVGLSNVENTALSTSTFYIGTTQITYNRASAAQTLAGVSVSGNSGTVTNGVYTTDTGTVTNTMLAGSIANNKLSNSTISGVALGGTLGALTVGYGLQLESGTTYDGSAAHTISNTHAVTGPVTVVANAYSLDLGTCNGVIILNNASQAGYTVTITGTPVAGKVVRLVCLNMKTGGGATTVTVSGLTAANSSNGTASFQGNANNSVAMVEFVCTTAALSGVYMNTGGAK